MHSRIIFQRKGKDKADLSMLRDQKTSRDFSIFRGFLHLKNMTIPFLIKYSKKKQKNSGKINVDFQRKFSQ